MRSRVGCRGKPFEVHDFGDKGMGVVAARDIQKGELLLREQPLFLVSQCRDSRQLDAWENEINAALRKLPEHDLQSFWNLADCHTDEKSVVGIVRTNGLPVETAEGDMVGVYPTVSRFNHSCNNNVNNSYQEEYGEVLHAIRDVAKGEELCITYIELGNARHAAGLSTSSVLAQRVCRQGRPYSAATKCVSDCKICALHFPVQCHNVWDHGCWRRLLSISMRSLEEMLRPRPMRITWAPSYSETLGNLKET